MQWDLERACEHHIDRFDCADALVQRARDGTYGLIVHDGGSSFVKIYVCPWCGTELHDGRVEATLDRSPDSDGIEFDLAPALAAAPDELLAAAARAQWSESALRPLFDLAAENDTSVSAELAKLRNTEASGEDGGDWWVDAMGADRWLKKHRPALAHAADDAIETAGRPGRRIDISD